MNDIHSDEIAARPRVCEEDSDQGVELGVFGGVLRHVTESRPHPQI